MYDNEFETKENKIWTKDKIEPQHIHLNLPVRMSTTREKPLSQNLLISLSKNYQSSKTSNLNICFAWLRLRNMKSR